MATERRKLTKGDVQMALAMVGREEVTFSDTQCEGLSLRVRKTAAVWCVRGRLGPKQTTWRIDDARKMPDPRDAREIASEAWKLIRRGVDPTDMLRVREYGGPVERHFDPERDGWTWDTARSEYLAHVARDKSKATYRDYRTALHSKDVRLLDGLLVKQVTAQHAKRIQDAIYARGKTAQARHVIHVLKPCFAWLADRAGSGITASPIAAVRPISASLAPAKEGYVPTDVELGRLPWRLEAATIVPHSRLAAFLILLTAQRIQTVISARKEDFEPLGSTMGIWNVPPAYMKSKRRHLVPLPPATWDVVRQAMALTEDREGWLFPQVRARRAGGASDGHISYHPVADPLDPLDPHDLRRGFVTHGEARLGLKRSDTKAILDHAEGKRGDVTAERYALHSGMHFKWAVMTTWENWLLELAARHAPVQGARLRTFVRPPVVSETQPKVPYLGPAPW